MSHKKTCKVSTKSLLMVLLVFIVSACTSKQDENNGKYTKLVKTATVQELSFIRQKHFPGIIEEAEEVNLAFRVAGPIQKIHVKEGDYVKKGQLIAEMDKRDYEVQKKAIESQVIQLRGEYDRIKELHQLKNVADNDYEKMKAGKEMAESKLKNAIDQLNDTRLYAPFEGYITNVNFEDGELVNHGTPIAKLIDVQLFKVTINVPASMYLLKDKIIKIECTQENIPDQTFPLTLSGKNIKANNNGLYKFYLSHKPGAKSPLVPGMNVSVHISYAMQDSIHLSIPINALFEIDDKSYVWVVNDEHVNKREVVCNGIIHQGNMGIKSGLNKDEQVVVGGLNLLQENETIRVIPPVSKTNVGNRL